ncbi:MAG: TerB N-terminal domain-containing protein [Candidatus Methanomethylophilaceae archaeon]|nr:TerB N-terminal domain-containing protein [Candidatus Methanomethylophilaceae archaeon]
MRTRRELMLVLECTRGHGIPRDRLSEFIWDYCLYKNLEFPDIPLSRIGDKIHIFLTEKLLSPTKDLPQWAINYLSRQTVSDRYSDMVNELFNRALRNIDADMCNTVGHGLLLEYCQNDRKSIIHNLFEDMPYDGGEGFSHTFFIVNEPFHEFCLGLINYCTRVCDSSFRKQVPRSFDVDMRRIVDRTASGMIVRYDKPPQPPVMTRRMMTKKELALFEMGQEQDFSDGLDEEFGDDPGAEFQIPVMITDRNCKTMVKYISMFDDFKRHWFDKAGPCQYVPSKYDIASYRSMNKSQTDYYLYWRDMVRNGTYLDTDTGYVGLYISELFSLNLGEWGAEQLFGLAHTYGDDDVHGLIASAYSDYCLYKGLPMLHSELYRSFTDMTPLIEMLVHDWPPLSLDYLLRICRRPPATTSKLLMNEQTAVATCRVLKEMDGGRGDIIKTYGLVQKTSYTRFDGYVIAKPGEVVDRLFMYRAWVGNSQLAELLSKIINRVLKVQQIHRGTAVSPLSLNTLGRNWWNVIKTITEDTIEQSERFTAAVRAAAIVLDETAVANAESDLKAVTEMMYIPGNEEPVETADEEAGPSVDGDPWMAFVGSLSEDELAYVVSCIDGTRKNSRLERSVNDAAMDTVGDVILDGGRVFEEYVEDVRKHIPQ